mgnify:CR=1 FL=1
MRIAIVSLTEDIMDKLYELLRNISSIDLAYIVDMHTHIITLGLSYPVPFSFDILISFDELEALRYSILVRPKGYIFTFRRREYEDLIPPYETYPREELIVGILSDFYNVKSIDISSDDLCIAYAIGLIAGFKNLDIAALSRVLNYSTVMQGYKLASSLLHQIK